MEFSEDQLHRYARHIVLKEIGLAGQRRLLDSRVLVVGAGGLGSPLLQYLAAAGVGTLGIVDDDRVDLSNLQRQVLHGTADIGRPKVDSAADAIGRINPDVRVERHGVRLTAGNALDLIRGYDLVADGTDGVGTRYLINDACYLARKPLVSGAVLQFDGQLATYRAYLGEPHPCYRCLYPQPAPRHLVPTCAGAGVLGAAAGTIGALQATEVVKELLGIGSLSGRLLMYQALDVTVRTIRVPRRPGCALCGPNPTITALAETVDAG